MTKKILLVQNNVIYGDDASGRRFRDTFAMLHQKARSMGGMGVSDVKFSFVPHPSISKYQALVAYGNLEHDYEDTQILLADEPPQRQPDENIWEKPACDC